MDVASSIFLMSLLTLAIWIPLIFSAFIAGLNLLPTIDAYPMEPAIATSLQTLFGYMMAWDDVFPIGTLVYCASIAIAYQLFIYTWKAVRWGIGFMRGSAT